MIAVYGAPPADLVEVPKAAVQTSDLIPGSQVLGDIAEGQLARAIVLAPPGTLERRFVLAQALRSLVTDAELIALAPKDKGGSRLAKELTAFGCAVVESGKRHHRLCLVRRPAAPIGLTEAIEAGAPRQVADLGWTQPGVFSWDRIDPGTAALLADLPVLAGHGADLGCGVGVLAGRVLQSTAVTGLSLIDIDRRAVACARRNVDDPRGTLAWQDVRQVDLSGLDFVVMNPPFHDGGAEDRALGKGFIATAARALRAGGVLWMVANRHLPYEAVLAEAFKTVRLHREDRAFKIYQAIR